jgi:glycosyltransferase involved in cell wall biosynthesis
MKGIHIVPHIEKEASGPTYSVVNLCKSCIKKGEFIILMTLGKKNNKLSFHKAHPRLEFFSRLGVSPVMRKNLDMLVKVESIDYIHSHGLWEIPTIYAGWVAKKHNIPLIVSPRGGLSKVAMKMGSVWIKRVFWMVFQKKMLSSAACFCVTSDDEYRDIRRMGFTQPVAVIPNGVDFKKRDFFLEKACKKLLFLGRVHPIKGIENLLHTWALVQGKFPNWELEIIGPGDKKYIKKILSIASALQVKRVTFSGALYGEDKWNAYRDASLYILPSFSENFAMTVAESLSVGTPVIATKGTPWSGLIKKNAGFWIGDDIKSIEECLLVSLNMSSKELFEMGLNGSNWMRQEFSWDGVSRQTIEAYEYILDSRLKKPSFVKLQ